MSETKSICNFLSGDDYDMDGSIGKLMRQVTISIARAVDARMAEHDLTDRQWAPLLAVAHKRCSSAAGIARVLDIDSGAMTRMIDRLETKGFMRRVRSTTDRRVVQLELTEAGHRIAALVPYALAETQNAHLAGFSQEEYDTLRSLLRRMLANSAASQCTKTEENPNA